LGGVVLLLIALGGGGIAAASAEFIEMPAATVQDKIRGGLLGQLLGNLNGLPHEFQYIAEPGNVTAYVPALPRGAWTDDDTDIEWVHITAMQRRGVTLLPPRELSALWKKHINYRIWCANLYARQLMELGMDPPLTGMVLFNPWSDFNISGQFAADLLALVAPGLPQTAARIGGHYTGITISGEPAQATQLFAAMIATAFLTGDLEQIVDAGEAAVDPRSQIREIVQAVRAWHRQHPDDWRATRQHIKDKYTRYGGAMRDRNGYELNTAAALAALLYGQGDYIRTSKLAFSLGWDADCNAAVGTTIIGVIKGARWMLAQGWEIQDVYRNTSRAGMPRDETITRFGDRLIAVAERVIRERGGEKIERDGKQFYRLQTERAANVAPLADPAREYREWRQTLGASIQRGVLNPQSGRERARAAYQAICLDFATGLREQYPTEWAQALAALNRRRKLGWALFYLSDTPAGTALMQRAQTAGWTKPASPFKNSSQLHQRGLWTAPFPDSTEPTALMEEAP